MMEVTAKGKEDGKSMEEGERESGAGLVITGHGTCRDVRRGCSRMRESVQLPFIQAHSLVSTTADINGQGNGG